MNSLNIERTIANIINRVLVDKGESERPLDASTVILGSDLAFDSLDLAALVIELEDATGETPFASGFINFRTIGELAALYAADTV